MLQDDAPSHSHLGKKTEYVDTYTPDLLFPVARQNQRQQLSLSNILPFYGYDVWNAYEMSWLNKKGKPEVAVGEFYLPCDTPFLVESKSIKLYLNSFNNTQFESLEAVQKTVAKDLSEKAQGTVTVILTPIHEISSMTLEPWQGVCLDKLDIACNEYQVNSNLLAFDTDPIEETVYSHLLRSNCPITNQPDWGSVRIHYRGKKIHHISLLQYIVSFRNHAEFHEHCVERIFIDIQNHCQPEYLTVEGRYTRRGGLDINAIRSTEKVAPLQNQRLFRQ